MSEAIDFFRLLRTLAASEFMLLAEVDFSVRNDNGQTLLHEAISARRPELVPWLASSGVDLNATDKQGRTALHYAAAYVTPDAATIICERGGDPNIADAHGNNALWAAALAAKGDFRVVRVLIKYGASPLWKNRAGRSVFDFAMQSGNQELMVLLGERR